MDTAMPSLTWQTCKGRQEDPAAVALFPAAFHLKMVSTQPWSTLSVKHLFVQAQHKVLGPHMLNSQVKALHHVWCNGLALAQC